VSRAPVASYRLTPADMTAAAASIGCRLSCPHVTRKTILEFDPAVVLVTNNSTDSRWWQEVAWRSTAWCLIRGRLQWKPTLQGQIALYFGDDLAAFSTAFSPFGTVLKHAPDTDEPR
jgi:hypothetical protein